MSPFSPPRPAVELTVRRLTRIAPRLIRMVAGGPGAEQFRPGPFTDAFVRIAFPGPGRRTRTYTLRSFDPMARELTIDFVDHGPAGLTPPWLARLRPGDPVPIQDVRGRYRPGSEADWHLLAGDLSALPAIAATLEAMRPGTRATVLIEACDALDEQPLHTAADADIRWLRRDRGATLPDAIRGLSFAPGVVQAFVHGEGGAIQGLRRHLLGERALPSHLLSISGYWRRGLDDEQWREQKSTVNGRPAPIRQRIDRCLSGSA